MTTTDYDQRCAQAATDQGLDPVVDVLTRAGIDVEVEQTGGMCMVAYVYNDDRSQAVGITSGFQWHGRDDGTYLVCHLPHIADDDHEGPMVTDDATLAQLPAVVAGVLA